MFFSYSNPNIFLKIKIFFNYFIITYLHREQHKNKQNIIKQLVCTTSSQLKFNYGIPFVRASYVQSSWNHENFTCFKNYPTSNERSGEQVSKSRCKQSLFYERYKLYTATSCVYRLPWCGFFLVVCLYKTSNYSSMVSGDQAKT